MDKASDFESEDCGFDPRQGLAEIFFFIYEQKYTSSSEHKTYGEYDGSEGVRTLDLRFTRATPYHLATKPDVQKGLLTLYIYNYVYNMTGTLNHIRGSTLHTFRWLCGATVARLTPDQKVACSNHVGVSSSFCSLAFYYTGFVYQKN